MNERDECLPLSQWLVQHHYNSSHCMCFRTWVSIVSVAFRWKKFCFLFRSQITEMKKLGQAIAAQVFRRSYCDSFPSTKFSLIARKILVTFFTFYLARSYQAVIINLAPKPNSNTLSTLTCFHSVLFQGKIFTPFFCG